MSFPHRELPLPQAITTIRERLYPRLPDMEAMQKIADEMGVALRTVYSWQSGEKGMNFANARKLKGIAGRVNISITTESMLRRGSASAPRRKK